MNLLVRPATEADLSVISEIYTDAVLHGTASFELTPPDEAEMARRWAALVAAGYPYLVAECDRAIHGYAYAGPYRTRAAYRSTVENSIYVAPASQGRGVGRALLQALVSECEARDFRLMVAVIGDEASRGSIHLHRSLGFQHVGVLKPVGYKHERWLATVLMQRVLGPGSDGPPTRPVQGERAG